MDSTFSSPLGAHTLHRLTHDPEIWLTTVDASGTPQPRPVWFIWDGERVTIYSSAKAWKLKHIAAHPNVALHFNSDPITYDFQVILGEAIIDSDAPSVLNYPPYLDKYAGLIPALDMTIAEYSNVFRIAIRVTPTRLRGTEPIPQP